MWLLFFIASGFLFFAGMSLVGMFLLLSAPSAPARQRPNPRPWASLAAELDESLPRTMAHSLPPEPPPAPPPEGPPAWAQPPVRPEPPPADPPLAAEDWSEEDRLLADPVFRRRATEALLAQAMPPLDELPLDKQRNVARKAKEALRRKQSTPPPAPVDPTEAPTERMPRVTAG